MNTFRRIVSAVSALLLLGSIGVIIYTIISTRTYEADIQQVTTQFRKKYLVTETTPAPSYPLVSDPTTPAGSETPIQLPDTIQKLMRDMQQYNDDIFKNGQLELTTSSTQDTILKPQDYGIDSGVAGIVRIPAISVEMPLYLGASYDNLAKGFATLSYTSLPVGGENTLTAIMGHRGWRGAAHLRDIESLSIGDSVFLDMPWGTLEYAVSEFRIIEPDDLSALRIRPGEDIVSLVTCHPYRVSTHRIVVYCSRKLPQIDEGESDNSANSAPTAPERPTEPITIEQWVSTAVVTSGQPAGSSASMVALYKVLPWASLALLSCLFIALVIFRRRK